MTICDIQWHLARTIGTDSSHETISHIIDAVLDAVTHWQRRPLEAFYPVMFLYVVRVQVRDGAQVCSRAAHIAIGVDLDGIKHVLEIWVETTKALVSGQRASRI